MKKGKVIYYLHDFCWKFWCAMLFLGLPCILLFSPILYLSFSGKLFIIIVIFLSTVARYLVYAAEKGLL